MVSCKALLLCNFLLNWPPYFVTTQYLKSQACFEVEFFTEKINHLNRYFKNLITFPTVKEVLYGKLKAQTIKSENVMSLNLPIRWTPKHRRITRHQHILKHAI